MKSERRHDLEKNDFEVWLMEQGEALQTNWPVVVGLLVVIVGGFFLYSYLTTPVMRNAVEWRQYLNVAREEGTATRDQDLYDFAKQHPKTPPAAWALIQAGDARQSDGLAALRIDMVKAKEHFEKAALYYSDAVKQTNDPHLLSRTHFGLGQAYESLGNLEKAKEAYGEVMKQPETPIAKEAAVRLEALSQPGTQEFYKWLAKVNLAEVRKRQGGAGMSPFDGLPNDPDLTLPSPDDVSRPIAPMKTPLGPLGPLGPALPEPGVPAPGAPEKSPAPAAPEKSLETPPAEPKAAVPPAEPKPAEPKAAPAPAPAK